MQDDETKSAIVSAFSASPAPVQDFVTSGKLEQFLSALQSELAIPQQAMEAVSNEVLFTLLQIQEPEELEEGLREEGDVPEGLIDPIVSKVSELVEQVVPVEPESEIPATEAPATPAIPVRASVPAIAAPAINTEPRLPAPARPAPAPRPIPPPQAPARPIPAPQPVASVAQPKVRTMASDVEAAQAPTHEVPKAAPVRTSPASAPVAPPAPPHPVVSAASPFRPSPAPAAPEAATVREDMKKYGIDPYREPIE